MKFENLPDPIQTHLEGFVWNGENHTTESSAEVLLFTLPGKQDAFLKVQNAVATSQEPDLQAEQAAMSWLHGKLSVPEVICFHEQDGVQYLLTTRIAGVSGINEEAAADIPSLIRMFASGLREIHSIPTASCHLSWHFERRRSVAAPSDSETIDSQKPEHRSEHASREELANIWAELPSEDICFIHGDYCLPNVMVHNGCLSGYLDWGYSGLGDRYLDFAAADYTISRNLGTEWVPLFFKEYRHDELDHTKLSTYKDKLYGL